MFVGSCSLTVSDAKTEDVETLKCILRWFELCSGMKINYEKCEMISIRTCTNLLHFLADVFGCKVRNLPSKYIGLPLCMGLPRRRLWDTVVGRVDRKLSTWKDKYLSLGGILLLIKSVLASTPIYYLSCFKCPSSIVKRLENFQRNFFMK